MRKLMSLLTALTIVLFVNAYGQYSGKLIHFTDNCESTGTSIAPPGFNMNSCWNALGVASNGKIYTAISSHISPLGNTALFKYEPDKNKMTSLGTIKSVSSAANNWMSNESQFKVHSFILEHSDGKMYFTSDDYDEPFNRGSHLYTIDPQTDIVTDYSKTQPYVMKRLAEHNLVPIPNSGALSDTSGVFVQYDGIQNIATNKKVPNLMYAFLYPDGDIIKYNTSTGAMSRIDTANNSIIYEDNSGNLFFYTLTGGNYNLKKYNVSNGQVTTIAPAFDTHVPRMFCPTQAGDTVFCLIGGGTGNGDVYRLIISQNKLEYIINVCGTYGTMLANMILSPNGKSLYYITGAASGWERYGRIRLDTIPAACELITYIGAQGPVNIIQNRGLLYGGLNVWDKLGNFYVAVWEYQTNVLDPTHIALFQGHTPEITNAVDDQWRIVRIKPVAEVTITPNPLVDNTRIRLVLPENSRVNLTIADIQGRVVTTVIADDMPRGVHLFTWSGTDQNNHRVAPGLYFCYLNGVLKEKIFLLKP